MSSKNKNSKQSKTANHEPMVRLRESVKAALAALDGVLDAVNAVCDVCDGAAAPKKPAGQAKTKPQTPAPKPAKPKADTPKKPAKQVKTPAKPQPPAPKSAKQPVPPAAPAVPAVPAAPAPHRRLPKSVRLTPHEITLNVGSQPVKELAENDAKDFLNNPKVFWYRPIQFPDPKRYGVQPRIEGARVVQRTDPKFSRSPWTVSLTIAIVGDDKKCDSWGTGVYNKNKGDQE